MSSITNDINEENDDFDDLIFTPKPEHLSSILNATMSGRQLSLTPPTDENFTADSSSEVLFEPQNNHINSVFNNKNNYLY